MRKPVFLLTLPVVTMLALQVPAGAVEMPGWVPFFGRKDQPVNTAPTPRDEASAAETLKRSEELEGAGKVDEAIKGYRSILRGNAFSSHAPKAQFKLGRALEKQGNYKDAYKAYTDYITKYPKGGEFDSAIQSQFEIAKLYLNGRKKRLLGVPIATDYTVSQEMFEGIVKRAPFHKLAPLAQFNVGQALEKGGNPTAAIGAYQEVITRYPGDPVADDAQYQIGYVQYHEAQTGSYDQNAKLRAREAFEDFVNRYPGSEKISQAKQNIQTLSGSDVKGSMDIAKFYDKTKNYKAAVVYYNEVIRVSPSSQESEQARKRIDELKGLVGVDALRSGPEKAQTGDMSLARRRAQAKVDVASRPDYNGPIVPYPTLPPLPGAGRPVMRTTPMGPIVEPPLPSGDPLQGGGVSPVPGPGEPLMPLPPLPGEPGAKPSANPPTAAPATPQETVPPATPPSDKPEPAADPATPKNKRK